MTGRRRIRPSQITPSLREQHTPDAVRRRLERPPPASYLRDFVYGAIDGIVTTFAVVAGWRVPGSTTRL